MEDLDFKVPYTRGERVSNFFKKNKKYFVLFIPVFLFAVFANTYFLNINDTRTRAESSSSLGEHPEKLNLNLSKNGTSGAEAVITLGDKLPEVANAYGLTPEKLARILREDKTLHVNKKGTLYYMDEVPQGTIPENSASSGNPPLPAPLDQTFSLHSLPGSKRIIYLDFDGHVLSSNAWTVADNGGADIIAPVWDIDGNPASFSDTERTRIQEIWQRVAEDYAPFDVDVTTELISEDLITRTNSLDENYGTRILISPISSYFGNYGGIAYVGIFNAVGDYYKPALVFPEKLGNGAKYIAEASSHECGHNLALCLLLIYNHLLRS